MFAPLLLCLVALLFVDRAAAQLTPRKLLAPAVKEYGPQYRDVELAFKAYNRRDFATAKRALSSVYKEHTELAPPEVMMALLHLSVGRIREAHAEIELAVVNHADDPEAYILLADLSLREGRRTIADLGYHRGRQLLQNIESNPHRLRNLKIRTHAGSASLAEVRGKYDRAAKELNDWIALDTKNPMPWGSLGRIEFRRKNYEAARSAFTKLKGMDKNAPPVEIAMGRLYSDAGMKDEALKLMELAVKNAREDARALLTVAEWALDQGHIEMARRNIAVVQKKSQDSIGAQVLSARLARIQGDMKEAESILTKAVLRSPNQFSVTNELARTLAVSSDAKRRAAGMDYARRNFQLYQNIKTRVGLEAKMTFAWLLLHSDRAKEAETAIATLTAGSTLSHENAYYLGKIYAKGGKTDVAVKALKAALARDIPFPGRDDAQMLLQSLTKKEE